MSELNYLTAFFMTISRDPRISITHIGIYAALLQYWQVHNFQNPIYAYSHEIMPIAKISGNATYYKVMKDLSDFGYIRYEPSYKRNQGSRIQFPLTEIKKLL